MEEACLALASALHRPRTVADGMQIHFTVFGSARQCLWTYLNLHDVDTPVGSETQAQ